MHAGLVLLIASLVTPAPASGPPGTDLTVIDRAAATALGPGFEMRSTPTRLTLACDSCAGDPVVDVTIGEQSDGTEDRVRAGMTTIADLETICRRRSPQCRMRALDVGPAVGWISAYPLGTRAGATAVIIRAGVLVTIRSLADDPDTAKDKIQRLLPLIRARIIGP